MNISFDHIRFSKRTILALSRPAIASLVLLAILVGITNFYALPALAGTGGSSCATALEIPLSDTYTGFVTSSTDDWFKVYISSPGLLSVGVFNNQVSSTDLSLHVFEHGCTAGDWIGSWYCPSGYSGWPIQEGDVWVTPGYYYVGFSDVGSCSGNCFFNFRVAWDPAPPALPDLRVFGGLTANPMSVNCGSDTILSFVIENDGAQTITSTIYIRAYLSIDSTITTGDTYLDQLIVNDDLSPGEGLAISNWHVTIPQGIATRDYYIGIILDPSDYIEEIDETNNTRYAYPFHVECRPDLTVASVSAQPAEVTAGTKELEVTYNIQNIGYGSVGTFSNKIVLSEDTTIGDADDIDLITFPVSSLLPGSSVGGIKNPTIPPDVEGYYYVGVIADSGGAISEILETNNTKRTSSTIHFVLPPLECSITVTSPYGGENWELGSTHSITWSSSNAGSNVKIELYKDSTYYQTITGSTSNDGSYSWVIPSDYDEYSSYRIKITDTSDSSCNDYSDGYFALYEEEVRSITVTSPNGGENWELESVHSIIWSSSNAGSDVKIELNKGSTYYQTITSSTFNDGSYSWSIPSSYDDYSSYRIKITDTGDSSCYDYSDGYFTLSEEEVCSITVTSPNGGENWELGSTHSIAWSSSNAGSSVKIELCKDSSYYQTITSSTSNHGSYSWVIPSDYDEYSSYRIKITDTSDSSCYGYTNGYFALYYECPDPGTPSNPSPPNHANGISTIVNLDWSDCANTDSYDVYFGTSSNPPFYDSTPDSSYSLPTLGYDTKYHWKIVAIDSCGASTTGPVWDFTTQTPPDTPFNASPANHATGVSLTHALQSSVFSDPDEGDSHAASQWQITTVSANYSSPIFDSGMDTVNLTQTTIPSGILGYNTTYYWRVRYQDSHGNWSEWSEEIQFKTEEVPPNGWRRFVLPGAIVLAGIVLTGIIWGNTTLRMKRNMRRWKEEGYDLSDWR